jgi:hypothetical protein
MLPQEDAVAVSPDRVPMLPRCSRVFFMRHF